ncbi:hypothetical protein EP7_002105 [Isosphaeraceae bacterium EP7]
MRARRPRISGRHVGLALLAGSPALVALLVLAHDWIGAIPWWFKKGCGWAVFIAALALLARRLWTVRAGDTWPEPPAPRPVGPAARWLPWALRLATLSLAWPLLKDPANLGFGDWDYFLEKFEAIRRTILVYGEFPWWDPWCRGGVPLAAGPQVGLVSIATPLVLAFGTSVGLRLAAVLMLLIAAEGARRLADRLFGDPWASALAALVYALNGGLQVDTVAGYFISMSYAAIPWLIDAVFRLERSRRAGLALGAWGAFVVLGGIQYPSIHGVLIAALVWARAVCVLDGPRRRKLLAHSAIAMGVALALSGWRIGTLASVMRDFPRKIPPGGDETLSGLLGHLLNRPAQALLRGPEALPPYFWESTCYVGPAVLIAAAISLAGGWKWWHTLMLGCGWLAAGGSRWYLPSYWLGHWPVFSTMHAVGRWRFAAMLGLGLAAASAVARWRSSGGRWRTAATILVLVVAADLLALGNQTLHLAFSIKPVASAFPGAPSPGLISIGEWPGFPAILVNRAVVQGYEPLLGYDRHAPTARTWQGLPGYHGEFSVGGRPVEPEFWSPNRVVLRVEPGATVVINQNPGSWWSINGRPADASLRCVEMTRPFEAAADAQGRLVLEIRPRGLAVGYGLHALGFGLILAGLFASGRPGDAPGGRSRAGPVDSALAGEEVLWE